MTVDKIPNEEFIVACEMAKLPLDEVDGKKTQGALKTTKPPNSNISKEERIVMKELKGLKEIMIMGANKGKCVVVQSTGSNEHKVLNMLIK